MQGYLDKFGDIIGNLKVIFGKLCMVQIWNGIIVYNQAMPNNYVHTQTGRR